MTDNNSSELQADGSTIIKSRDQRTHHGLRASALAYLTVLLLIPLAVIFQDALRGGLTGLWHEITLPAAVHALKLTLWTAAVMTAVNTVFGLLTAYTLVRCSFPGKALLNSIVDLPLSIPTLVTGVMLVILYGPQQNAGAWLEHTLGIRIIFAPPGIILALLFITFPFVVRAVQPVLERMKPSQENAAATMGAGAWTIFHRITLPPLILPLTSGALLGFARAIGEFGSIVIVAGNIPFYSQTAAVYLLGEVESENRLGASAVSILMLVTALLLIIIVDWLQNSDEKRST